MKLVKLKCEVCKAQMEFNEDLKKVICNHCGTEYLVDDGLIKYTYRKIDEARIKENERKIKEMEYKDKDKKRDNITLFVCFGIMLFMIFLSFGFELYYVKQNEPDKNEVKIPMSVKKYKGENYEFVIEQLKDAGFNFIEAKPIYDLVTGFITKDGEVESVSIAGDTEFEEGEIFSKDSQIIITYHTFKKEKK